MKRAWLLLILLLPVACSKQGNPGTPGKDGTQIYSGATTPAVGQGAIGDYYLDLATGELYGPKTDSGWGTPIQIQGSNGVSGSQIYSGTTVPANTLGNVGDYYFDKTTLMLYGPKTANGWAVPVTLQGAQGPQGNANVKTITDTPTNAQWISFGFYDFALANGGYSQEYTTRYVDVPFSAVTQGVLDSGMLLVYMNPDTYFNANDWQPVPYQFEYNSYYFEFAYEPNVGTVRLHFFFATPTANVTTPDIFTYNIPTYPFKLVAVTGTTVTDMKRQKIDFADYNQVSKFIQ